LEEAC